MDNPLVHIENGALRGITLEGYNGLFLILAFLGIPYAKPPIGELRFKAPVPAEPWNGTKDAIKDGSACFQKNIVDQEKFLGSEDCLYLNVFTKNISREEPLKPVLVFFHGGAFLLGSSEISSYGPALLLKEDIVLVTVNYRLGVLGYLKLNDASLEVPGNAGLKDQVLALKWIQKNINKFGGDPNKVTISGESAGSASVNYHLLSPTTKGLFHGAIMQSGTVLNPWPSLNPKYLEIVNYLRKDCECTTDRDIFKILNGSSVEELVEAQSQWTKGLDDATFRWFAPSVENPNPTAFLTAEPIHVITSGNYNKVPIIIGYNSNEGLFAATNDEEAKKFARGEFRPQQMVLTDDEETKRKLVDELRRLYTNEKYENNIYLPTADSMFTVGITAMAEHFMTTNPKRTYFYVFDLIAKRNMFRNLFNMSSLLIGACHADELGYLFDSELLKDIPIKPGSIEDEAINRMTKLWGNFVKYGNPTPEGNNLNFTWKPATKDNFYYLHFGRNLSLERNPAEDRMKIWREIFKSNATTKNYFP